MLWYIDLICTIYWPEKKTAKIVTKNWNWPFLISHQYKPSTSTLAINLRWSEIRDIICRPKL